MSTFRSERVKHSERHKQLIQVYFDRDYFDANIILFMYLYIIKTPYAMV